MAKGFELELMPWSNGEVHLTFWDTLNGKDVDFILHLDGTVTEWIKSEGFGRGEYPKRVDLPMRLRELCRELYESDRP